MHVILWKQRLAHENNCKHLSEKEKIKWNKIAKTKQWGLSLSENNVVVFSNTTTNPDSKAHKHSTYDTFSFLKESTKLFNNAKCSGAILNWILFDGKNTYKTKSLINYHAEIEVSTGYVQGFNTYHNNFNLTQLLANIVLENKS